AEGEQLPRERGRVSRRLVDELQIAAQRVGRQQAEKDHLTPAADDGEEIVEIVGDAARELTYAFHALRMQQLLLETLPRRNILEDRDEIVGLLHGVSRDREREIDPDLRPVLVHEALLAGERPDFAGEELSNARLVGGEIIAMGDGEERAGQELLVGV